MPAVIYRHNGRSDSLAVLRKLYRQGIHVEKGTDYHAVPLLLSVMLLMLQHAVLCYNLLSGNYVLVQPSNPEAVPDMAGIKLCKSAFEAFIRKEKPYLNPKLKNYGFDTLILHQPHVYVGFYQSRVRREFQSLHQFAAFERTLPDAKKT